MKERFKLREPLLHLAPTEVLQPTPVEDLMKRKKKRKMPRYSENPPAT